MDEARGILQFMRHTVAVSDIHLCEAEPGTGLWMRYRQKQYSPDAELAEMFDTLRARVRGDELTVVLNGDIFDFDAPRVVGDRSEFHDLPRTAEHAVPMIAAMVDDHPAFIDALARVLADGHSVVFVSGNHDVQLTLPEVREYLRRRLVDATLAADRVVGQTGERDRRAIGKRVIFRAWFYKSPDGLVFEHGHQYDSYCSYRYPMAPFGGAPGEIQPTMGSLATRLLVSRMGYFNPHVDGSFMLSTFGYLAHWAKYYLFSTRSIAVAWAVGAVRTLIILIQRRDPERRELRWANIRAAVRETGSTLRAVARHSRLFRRPSEDKLSIVLRELWLDRVGLLGLTLVIAALMVWLLPGLLKLLALTAPLLMIGYEARIPKLPLGDVWRRVGRAARKVGKIHHARAVVFGHTHHPDAAWEGGVFFGNTGSWSAAYRDVACTEPLFERRPLVWLSSTDDVEGPLRGGLMTYRAGDFQLAEATETATASVAYSVGTKRARMTPGIEAAKAMANSVGNPTHSAT